MTRQRMVSGSIRRQRAVVKMAREKGMGRGGSGWWWWLQKPAGVENGGLINLCCQNAVFYGGWYY